jgi:hypothetical protein
MFYLNEKTEDKKYNWSDHICRMEDKGYVKQILKKKP